MEFTREYTHVHGDEYETYFTGCKNFDTAIKS